MTTIHEPERPARAGKTSESQADSIPSESPQPENAARTGKIARLPQSVRDELNQRLRDGLPGKELVGWLNGLPEVSAILHAQFAGRAITEQNLSEWRSGGYREWLHWEKTQQLARELGYQLVAGNHSETSLPGLLVRLSHLYASTACQRIADADPEEGFRLLRRAFVDLSKLWRTDLLARRLKLQQDRQESPSSSSIQPDPTSSSSSPAASRENSPDRAEATPPRGPSPAPSIPMPPPASSKHAEPPFPSDGWWTPSIPKPAPAASILHRPKTPRPNPIQSGQIQPKSQAGERQKE